MKNYFPPVYSFLGSDVHCCQCKHSPSVPASDKFFSQKKQDTETHVSKEHGVW